MASNTTGGESMQRSTEEEEHSMAMTLLMGFAPPMVLTTVVELGVLEIIKKEGGHMSPDEIVGHLPSASNPAAAATMLDRLLRLLASYGVLTCMLRRRPTTKGHQEERTYGLAPAGVFFTNADHHLSPVSLHMDKLLMECWFHLKDAILDGKAPFEKAYGMNFFEYGETDQRVRKIFNNNMSKMSSLISKKIVENYDGFEGISTLVEVGGGLGTTLNLITSKYPSIKGINFDLPNVIQNAPSYPGLEHVGGDMFVSIPKGDAIFMKWICHDWTDELCVKLLKNCYDALPSHGKVIICDSIMPVVPNASNEARSVLHFDFIMLTICPGGKERTKDEFEYLAEASGFKRFRIAGSAYDLKVMELYKNN